jgi:hypothetical protein
MPSVETYCNVAFLLYAFVMIVTPTLKPTVWWDYSVVFIMSPAYFDTCPTLGPWWHLSLVLRNVCVCVCARARACTHTHTHIHIYIYVHTHIHVTLTLASFGSSNHFNSTLPGYNIPWNLNHEILNFISKFVSIYKIFLYNHACKISVPQTFMLNSLIMAKMGRNRLETWYKQPGSPSVRM